MTSSTTLPAGREDKEKQLHSRIRESLEAWARYVLMNAEQSPAAHHLQILKALEDVCHGRTERLMLLLPPGSAKSTYTSRIFPAWWFGKHPRSAVIAASHTASLAENFGRSVRGMIAEYGGVLDLTLRQDARAAGRFEIETGGEYFSVGVRGAVTGRRADLALIDDPIASAVEAESYSAREHLWDWFRSELVTRLKPKGRIILIMTRWHTDDLAGRLIERGGWDVLRFPALAEPGDALGRVPGAALWPEWENEAALLAKKAMLGERHFSALFQQNPLGDAGQMFDACKLRVVDRVPAGQAVRAWDLAATMESGSDPDWTVGLKLVRAADGQFFIDDVVRFRAVASDVAARILESARHDGREVLVALPQDPGQAGKAQVQYLTQALAGFRVTATPETGSKATRAFPVASQISAGNVSYRRAGWNAVFMDELATFPNGKKDDQVDALSRAFLMLTQNNTAPAMMRHVPFFTR